MLVVYTKFYITEQLFLIFDLVVDFMFELGLFFSRFFRDHFLLIVNPRSLPDICGDDW